MNNTPEHDEIERVMEGPNFMGDGLLSRAYKEWREWKRHQSKITVGLKSQDHFDYWIVRQCMIEFNYQKGNDNGN